MTFVLIEDIKKGKGRAICHNASAADLIIMGIGLVKEGYEQIAREGGA